MWNALYLLTTSALLVAIFLLGAVICTGGRKRTEYQVAFHTAMLIFWTANIPYDLHRHHTGWVLIDVFFVFWSIFGLRTGLKRLSNTDTT